MYKILLLFILSTIAFTGSAQTIKGKIISSADKQPIPYATIKLKLSGNTVLSNSKGEFTIEKDIEITADTLVISNVGYFAVNIATAKLPKNGIIELKEDEKTLSEVNVKGTKKQYKMLNEFTYSNAVYTLQKDIDRSFVSSKFPIAKLFTSEVDSFKLESIHLGRFMEDVSATGLFVTSTGNIFTMNGSRLFYDLKKPVRRAIFNMYIIYTNEVGEPDQLSKAIKIPVDVQNSGAEIEIDVRSYNIRPKQRNFYVAIEWLPILPNQNYSLGVRGKPRIYRQFAWPIPKTKKRDGSAPIALIYEVGYEPFISMYNPKIENATQKYVWIQNQWEAVEPDPAAKTDEEIALSTKISYY